METKNVPSGSIILHAGQPVDTFWYLSSGSVKATFEGGSITLRKGDIIGLPDFDKDSHFFTYTAAEDSSIMPYATPSQLMKSGFFADKPAHMAHLALSMNHILSELISHYDSLLQNCQKLYQFLQNSHRQYQHLCEELHAVVKQLDGIRELEPIQQEELFSSFQSDFYKGTNGLFMKKEVQSILCSQNIIPGYLYHASTDLHQLLHCCEMLSEYSDGLIHQLLNEEKLDLFDLFASLSLRAGSSTEQDQLIQQNISDIVSYIELFPGKIPYLVSNRLQEYQMQKEQLKAPQSAPEVSDKDAGIIQTLSTSLQQILEFADCSAQEADEFTRLISEYKALPDKNAATNEASRCRKALTAAFYRIYISAFQISLSEPSLPTVLKMFFNFGYVDAELCGTQCATFLYQLAERFGQSTDIGIYSIYEWLYAIYTGKKNPSINEFEEDYDKHVRSLKVERGLSDEVANRMLQDRSMMVMYEMNNMFQSASKISNGHLATFCPVLSEHQFLKPPQDALLYPDQIKAVLDDLRKVDFSLFYREVNVILSERDNIHDFLHMEVLPDIIFMPVVGTRGVMWQEIADKNRKTPARMMLPVFQLEDVKKVLSHMAGEFRWEMCKRVQGGRWNDVSDPSLTSLYCDYLQFYRKNSDLSAEAKEKVKLNLQRSKQSYKAAFVSDYVTYITYESAGSPHLNRVSRSILFQFCPFSQAIRTKLLSNPIYHDPLDKHRIRCLQKCHKMENLQRKLESKRLPVPPVLLEEIDYYNM